MGRELITAKEIRKRGQIMADKMDAQTYLECGRGYVVSRDTDKAISAFKEALLLDPELTLAREMLGACYFDKGLWYSNNGNNANAIAEYKKAICIAESMSDTFTKEQLSTMYFNLGAAYSQASAWKTAYFYFGKAKDINPADEECQQAYINAQFKRAYNKEFRGAIPPSSAYEYADRGKRYLQKGDYDKAIADFNDAIILYPKDAADYEKRGEAYMGKGDYNKAITDFTTAIGISPSYNAYTQRGNACETKKDHDKAITDYTGAINISPKSYDAYKKRGAAYEAKGEHGKAKADFAQAEQLQKKEAASKKRNLIIGLIIAAIIVGLIIKCAVG
jgi:tetratricopeptide (TPR) repeat protein